MKQFVKILLYIIYYFITNIKTISASKYFRIDERSYFTVNSQCSITKRTGTTYTEYPYSNYECFILSGTYQDPTLYYDNILQKPIYLISDDNTNNEIHIVTF